MIWLECMCLWFCFCADIILLFLLVFVCCQKPVAVWPNQQICMYAWMDAFYQYLFFYCMCAIQHQCSWWMTLWLRLLIRSSGAKSFLLVSIAPRHYLDFDVLYDDMMLRFFFVFYTNKKLEDLSLFACESGGSTKKEHILLIKPKLSRCKYSKPSICSA